MTEEEAEHLDMFLRQAIDAACGDDRPDHGLARLRTNWRYEPFRNDASVVYGRVHRWLMRPHWKRLRGRRTRRQAGPGSP
jgi:hypothetical protein